MLTRHLVELGHRRIALCSSTGRTRNLDLREEGFRSVMQKAGLDAGISTSRNPAKLIEEWSKNKTSPTAIVADTVATTIELLHACWHKAFGCRKIVDVAGLEDAYPADKLTPPLTAMRLPAEELGSEAANLLIDQIEGEQSALPRKIFLIESLVIKRIDGPGRVKPRTSAADVPRIETSGHDVCRGGRNPALAERKPCLPGIGRIGITH